MVLVGWQYQFAYARLAPLGCRWTEGSRKETGVSGRRTESAFAAVGKCQGRGREGEQRVSRRLGNDGIGDVEVDQRGR